ncbi:hypothetical protein J5Y03_09030 [Bacillus sp. RG28]|uniref:Uncharacterized protein n=1 Tax=Gottfriedia endophytica TaxID=2820819 RepID=A0A940NQY7_9BACI|nr:hypothetical protein [Gottfriedia endophytica]MBP0725332.1 hypothetical protein [Gottfriedia endophytica]
MIMNKKGTVITIILIIFICYFYYRSNSQIYGNDKKSIIKVIQSIDSYKNKELIEVLKIVDIKNDRFVAFLYNNRPAYIQFVKNEQGNYRWTNAENGSGESLGLFHILLENHIDSKYRILLITNQENNIAKIIIKVNSQKIVKEISIGQKYVSMINIPKSKDNSYSFEYMYFDKDGRPIIQE